MKSSKHLQALFRTENERLQKLNDLVSSSIEDESLITGKVLAQEDAPFSLGDRIADKVASFGGSWNFILTFVLILVLWIAVNTFLLWEKPFDPYPFILLNLILSCVAALQAPIIMMSQNRKDVKDRRRSEEDYAVNLKTEIEMRRLHQKVDVLMMEQMKSLFEMQQMQCELLEQLQKKVEHHRHDNHNKPSL